MKNQEIIECLQKENDEFKKLSKEHQKLESILAQIDRKIYLTAEEEIERKKAQKQKLLKKDRMAEMVRDFKERSEKQEMGNKR